ncbi:MAG TPA: aspartate:alanine exchanger family transporter [Bacteroidales bacterium]|nr:aspartate:alanine exchanger family transporter [Bacteroidales bacterium]
MEADLYHQGYFVLFLILSLGIVLGNVRFRGFALDSSAVIFVALLLGHFGYRVPAEFQTLGLLLFIFTIGIQAGPGFFDAFMKHGRKLITISLLLIGSAAALTAGAAYLLDIDVPIAVGLFNGALTSTPGLAAGIEVTGSPNAALGYGLAYPVGVIGVILFIGLAPQLMKINIKKQEQDYLDALHVENPELKSRVFRITNSNVDGRSLAELDLRNMTQAIISRVKMGNESFVPTANTRLRTGDLVKAVGDDQALKRLETVLGEPVQEELTFDDNYQVEWLLVTNRDLVNKSLREIGLGVWNATVTRIRRSGIDLKPLPHSKLRFGDKILVSGSSQGMPHVRKLAGNDEKRLSETNFLPISLGIVIGVLVGSIHIPLGPVDFSLGLTGGVLLSALILSNIGKTGPIIWSMSGGANQLLRRLGLLMFMATVGTEAGSEIAEVLSNNGLILIAAGVVITIIPMIIGLLFGHYILKINFLTLLGVITGSMTSTPGLGAIDSKTESEAPAVGYATVYPASLVLMILFSQLMARLL